MKFESCAFECLVSGCPSLLKLTIYHCSGLEDFYVSSALKSLHIEDDEVIKSICLKQTQNLASITLLANGLGDEIDREWVTDLFKDLSKLERLSLGTAYIEILSAGVGINLQVLLKDVKHLELKGNNSEAVETQQISKEFDCINCKFNKLLTLDMTVKTSYKPALDFTRFVLANSPAFKKLTFKVGLDLNQSNAPILLSISQDLLQMERASPRSQVKFLHGARLCYF
uniref:Uncharacterized protein n=1 Tax=Cajanus cajan TaxID=3821 RepID=A0A151QZF5_CAJCA|nr:hypothetical protein KK1_043315 [Cajanus cajan]